MRRASPSGPVFSVLLAVVPLLAGSAAAAVETGLSFGVGSEWSSNVYADDSREWDHALMPTLDAWLDFAGVWSLAYIGAANWFARHDELFSHSHRLELSAAPAWGGGTVPGYGLSATLAAETLRNDAVFADLNNVGIETTVGFAADPSVWLRLQLWGEARLRLLYDNRMSDAVDAQAGGSATFTLPSRTTLTPRIVGGARWYLRQSAQGGGSDLRVEPSIHVSQGVWETGGLQADYTWHGLIGGSSQIDRAISMGQFTWLGEEFVTGGHRVSAGFTQIIAEVAQAEVGLEYRTRSFAGWPATDAAGALTGGDRADRRLSVAAGLVWAWWLPAEESGPAVPGIDLSVHYSYSRQWSNSAWYDTDIHTVRMSATGSW